MDVSGTAMSVPPVPRTPANKTDLIGRSIMAIVPKFQKEEPTGLKTEGEW